MNPEFKQTLQDTIEKTWKEGFDKGVDIGMGIYLKILVELHQRGAFSDGTIDVITSQMQLELQRITMESRLSGTVTPT